MHHSELDRPDFNCGSLYSLGTGTRLSMDFLYFQRLSQKAFKRPTLPSLQPMAVEDITFVTLVTCLICYYRVQGFQIIGGGGDSQRQLAD